jgi:ubiquinone/menaquinone biosynthesis C-methylase UbiE
MDNNREFWNKYVKKFENNPDNKKYRLLGHNWKGEELFVKLLHKYTKSTDTALEIGCGGGRITEIASLLCEEIIATDISPEMISKASSEIKAGNIIWNVNDGFSLDEYKSNSINLVYSHDVFVHFSSMQTYPYLKHIQRILKPQGTGIISFYNYVYHFNLFKNESLRFNKNKIFPPSMRHHFVTQQMIELMLNDLNYDILEFDITNFLIVIFRKK